MDAQTTLLQITPQLDFTFDFRCASRPYANINHGLLLWLLRMIGQKPGDHKDLERAKDGLRDLFYRGQLIVRDQVIESATVG